MSITIKGFASPSIKTRMPPVNQSTSDNNRSRKNNTKKAPSSGKALVAGFFLLLISIMPTCKHKVYIGGV